MSKLKDARLLMSAVAELHERGYGRLKLYCYVKEGLGVWRPMLFAGDTFPSHASDLPRERVGEPFVRGSTPGEVADSIEHRYGELLTAARGADPLYVDWYRSMLASEPQGVLVMESPRYATVGGIQFDTPYLRPERHEDNRLPPIPRPQPRRGRE